MAQARALAWPAVALAVLGSAAALERAGYFDRLDNAVAESRARLLAHEVDSAVVVVGIDAPSLRALSEWPWPRRHHARLLQQLGRSDPAGVFLDIDFSSYSSAEDDALLERELERWKGPPVLLASHFQRAEGGTVLTEPLPRFARHAQQVSVTLEPDPDGLVRRMRTSWSFGRRELRSAFAHGLAVPDATEVPINFSIRPSSFQYVSFVNVLDGTTPPATFDGKHVYVGAVAPELSDTVAVPVYRSLPGIVVQALSMEAVRAGRITAPAPWLLVTALGIFAAAGAAAFGAHGWKRNLLGLAGAFVCLAGLSVALYAGLRIDLPVVPFAFVLVLLFVAATVHSLDRQTVRALAYAIGLARKDALLKSVIECSIDCIVCIDGRGVVRTANPAASNLFGAPANALVGRSIDELLPNLRAVPGATLDGLAGSIVERSGRRSGGAEFPVEVAVSRVGIDDDELFTAIVRDIRERKEHEARLEHQATHDALTGLPNRTALTSKLKQLLDASGEARLCLLMVDLCRFKDVNDTLGHDIGDEVLSEVALRFRGALDKSALICRLGGDEFTVVLPRYRGRRDIDRAVHALVESLRAPINVRGISLEVGSSVGVALAPEHADDAKQLLQRADVAMYEAKRRGTAVEYYDRAHDSHTVRRLAMVSELRTAIAGDELSLDYQPQIDLRSGRVRSLEALLRWDHPKLGRVSPGEFVPLAETTDLIRPLTDWTVSRALRDMLTWSLRGAELVVAVNVSARVVQDAQFPARFATLLSSYGIEPARLELEITETAMMSDPGRAQRVITALKSLGVSIAIDDYGTGFSSLGYLRDLNADMLKLDQSFVTDLEHREHNRVIVESTARMAQSLGLQVAAEGVETEWVAGFVKRAGYDVGQGFHFARPLASDRCLEFVQASAADERRAVS